MPQTTGCLLHTLHSTTQTILTAALATALTFMIAACALAEPPPASVYGNYTGTGKCPPGSQKSCTDTGTLDNVYIQPNEKQKETAEEKQQRESFQLPEEPQPDVRIAIRILRNHGHYCTMEGGTFWVGDHLRFQEGPAAHGTIPANCRLQLWFKHDGVTLIDPDNACSEGYCSIDKPIKLAGMRFKQGPDALLATHKKSATPPPAAIFGKYNGTGTCATDERKTIVCNENKRTDFISVQPSETADARVELGRSKSAGDSEDYFCLRDADAVWLGDHLTFIKEMPDSPGRPHLVEFWFKNDTVVVRNVWNNHCGTYIQGVYFKKSPSTPSHPTQR